jgi:hypothetical protein
MSKFRFPFGGFGKNIDLLFLTINFQKRVLVFKFVSIIFFIFFIKNGENAKKTVFQKCPNLAWQNGNKKSMQNSSLVLQHLLAHHLSCQIARNSCNYLLDSNLLPFYKIFNCFIKLH